MSKPSGMYKRCGCRNPDTGRRYGVQCPQLSQRGHGAWEFVGELPAGRDGRRRRLRRCGFRSRTAAIAARQLLLGVDADSDRSVVTVGQWLDLWLEMRYTLSFSTRRMYTQHIRDYLKPYLGGVQLIKLTVGDIQAMFTALIRTGAARRHPLSPATLHRIRGLLHVVLNDAIRRFDRPESGALGAFAVGSTPSGGGVDGGPSGALAGDGRAAAGGSVDGAADHGVPRAHP